MKYLTLSPDYSQSCIREDFSHRIEPEELDLSKDLIKEIELWHNKYRKIIPLIDEERKEERTLIDKLDKRGIELAKQIASSVEGGAKIKYFSEGLLRQLPVI